MKLKISTKASQAPPTAEAITAQIEAIVKKIVPKAVDDALGSGQFTLEVELDHEPKIMALDQNVAALLKRVRDLEDKFETRAKLKEAAGKRFNALGGN